MSVPYPPNAYQTNPYQPQPKVRFEWISESWQLFTANAGIWIAAILVQGLISGATAFVFLLITGVFPAIMAAGMHSGAAPNIYAMPGYWVATLLNYLIAPFFLAGLLRMANAQVRRQPLELGMLFSGGKVYLPLLGFIILYAVATLIGGLLLVIPGLIAAALLAPALPLIADGVPVGEAINRSVAALKADLFTACLFLIAFGLIALLGTFLTCGLGSFALSPMQFLILALVYRDMIGMPLGASPTLDPNIYGAAQPGVWPPAPGAPAPNPYATQSFVQPQSSEQSSMPPYYQAPPAGAPPPPNHPDDPERSREDDPGISPPPSMPGS